MVGQSAIADSVELRSSYREAIVDELHRRMVRHIRELANAQKIPLTHLPDRAGVSKAHFFDVIAGRKSPTLQWLAKLAAALGVDVVDLLAQSSARTSST